MAGISGVSLDKVLTMWTAQTDSEASANIVALQRAYLTKLNRRLQDGSISRKYYDDQLWLIEQDLEPAQWEGVKELVVEVAKNATVNLPGTLATAGDYVAAGAGAVANSAGKIAGTALKGAGSGLFGNIGLAGGGLALLVASIWLFGWGPLSTFKFKGK